MKRTGNVRLRWKKLSKREFLLRCLKERDAPEFFRKFAEWLADPTRCQVELVRLCFDKEPDEHKARWRRRLLPVRFQKMLARLSSVEEMVERKRISQQLHRILPLAKQRAFSTELARRDAEFRTRYVAELTAALADLHPFRQIAHLNKRLGARNLLPPIALVDNAVEGDANACGCTTKLIRELRHEQVQNAFYSSHPELNAPEQAAAAHTGAQAGAELVRLLKLRGQVRLDFETVLIHFGCPEIWTALHPPLWQLRVQRLLYGSVCALLHGHRAHAPQQLSRFIVYCLGRKVWPQVPAGLPFDLREHFPTKRRRRIIRQRLKLPKRLAGLNQAACRQRLRQYDRILQAIIGREQLRTALLRLHHECKPAQLRKCLEAAFRHIANEADPSISQSVEDIAVTCWEDLRTMAAKNPQFGSKSLQGIAVEKQVSKFRESRRKSYTQPPAEKSSGSVDAMLRQARIKWGLK